MSYINIKTRKFVEKEIKNLRNSLMIILKKNATALKLARKELRLRLESMNEIRKQLSDQATTFVKKDELRLVEKDIKVLSRLVFIGLGVLIVWQLLLTMGII